MSISKRIGFSLSGGGLSALSYVSFFETLRNEYGIEPSLIAGLSGGAMVAPYIANKVPKEEVFDVLCNLVTLRQLNWRLKHIEIIDHHSFAEYFREHLPVKVFQDLDTKTVIFATNVKTQETEVLDTGDIASAITASCSIYPIFMPVKRRGKLLTDGGYTTTYGSHFLRGMDLDALVGIDVTGINEGNMPRFFRSFYYSLNSAIRTFSNYEEKYDPVDLDIRLSVPAPSFMAFKHAKQKLFATGDSYAHQYASKIKKVHSQL